MSFNSATDSSSTDPRETRSFEYRADIGCLDPDMILRYCMGAIFKVTLRDRIRDHLETCLLCRQIAEEISSRRGHQQGILDVTADPVAPWKTAEPKSKPERDPVSDDAGKELSQSEPQTGSQSSTNPSSIDREPVLDNTTAIGGRFKIRSRVGIGGYATVFQAEDSVLGREVALKLPHLPPSLHPVARRRFLTELRATAALHHPNIVPVFDAGLEGDRCYLVSEFVPGITLQQWLVTSEKPATPETSAQIVAQLADGIHHAHEQGILHRDLKPANVLLDSRRPGGELAFVPRIADFGLAIILDDDTTTSRDGSIVGSASYMSPEQARGERTALSPASDVYALGVILYRLASREFPIRGVDSIDTLQRVNRDEPVPLRRHQPKIPKDLEAICLKCLEKRPESRYSSAQLLAADLRRFLNGVPVLARHPSLAERTWRLAKRHPSRATAIVAVVIAIISTQGMILRYSGQISRFNKELTASNNSLAATNRQLESVNGQLNVALDQARKATVRAEAGERSANETLYVQDMQGAAEAWRNRDALGVSNVVDRYSDGALLSSYRGIEFHWLRRLIPQESLVRVQLPCSTYRMAMAPNSRTGAIVGQDAIVRMLDVETGSVLDQWPTDQKETNGVEFSPEGSTLWTAGDDGTLRAWNVETHEQLWCVEAHPQCVVFEVLHDPERQLLITCANEPLIRLWDSKTGESKGVLNGHARTVNMVIRHPDGRHLCSVSLDESVRMWDLDSQRSVETWPCLTGNLFSLAISPNGKFLFTCSSMSKLHVIDLQTRRPIGAWKLLNNACRIAFDRTGNSVYLADHRGFVYAWPTSEFTVEKNELPVPRQIWRVDQDRLYDLHPAPTGERIMALSKQGSFQIWNAVQEDLEKRPLLKFRHLRQFVMVPRTESLIAVGDRSVVHVDYSVSPARYTVLDQSADWCHASVSADARLLVAYGHDERMGLWRLSDLRRLVDQVDSEPEQLNCVAITPDGRWMALSHWGGKKVVIQETETGREQVRIPTEGVDTVSFASDGASVVFNSLAINQIVKWRTGELLGTFPTGAWRYQRIIVSPDGNLLAVLDDREIRLCEAQTGKLLRSFSGHLSRIRSVCFSPDQRTIASTGDEQNIRLWNVATGQFLFELPTSEDSIVEDCQFTSEGRWLAYSSELRNGDGFTIQMIRMK